jgi:hypothetical protein
VKTFFDLGARAARSERERFWLGFRWDEPMDPAERRRRIDGNPFTRPWPTLAGGDACVMTDRTDELSFTYVMRTTLKVYPDRGRHFATIRNLGE